MRFDININKTIRFIDRDEVDKKLDRILRLLREIQRKEVLQMATLADLQAKVAANTTVIGSAITLLQGLKAKLDEAIANGDPVAIQALSDEIGAASQALADAVVANTPAG